MKRFWIVSAAALTLALPLAPSSYAQPNDNTDHRHDNDHRNDTTRSDHRNDGDTHSNWDPGQHNGYTAHGRWHYGRPPASIANYQPGWRRWRRGDRLPYDFRTRYVVVNDWRAAHLRPPPRGYHWVRDDRGEYILVGIATGLILSAILNHG